MGFVDRMKKAVHAFGDMGLPEWTDGGSSDGRTRVPQDPVSAQQSITTEQAKYLIDRSHFEQMEVSALYAMLYVDDPVVGGVTDRISTLMRQSYQGVYIKETGKAGVPLPGDKANKEQLLEAEMLAAAKEQEEAIGAKNMMETLGETLFIYGNVYIHPIGGMGSMTYEMFPPEYVTYVKTQDMVNIVRVYPILTNPGYFVLNERNTFQFERRVIPADEVIHIKYKDTPQILFDRLGRCTYGVYSISPLHRAVLSIWWKRQVQIIDLLWRARNVPREHHAVKADVFSLNQFDGKDWQTKRVNAQVAAMQWMKDYTLSLQKQAPDAGYVTLDTVDIKYISPNSSYMQTNELYQQIEDQIWTALNIPPSVVNGQGTSSYASELVISNYVSAK